MKSLQAITSTSRFRHNRLPATVVLLVWGLWTGIAIAQPAQPTQPLTPRVLAPGVMIPIPPEHSPDETVARHDVVELLAEEPTLALLRTSLQQAGSDVALDANLDFAKKVVFRRDVWCLEFQFKPVRFVWVDLPKDDGTLERKLIWYLVYSVTNGETTLRPTPDTTKVYRVGELDRTEHTHTTRPVGVPVRFIPRFVLAAPEFQKAYPDLLIPAAIGPISLREDPARTFYNSQNIADKEIAPGETVWGIATWESIDPRVDFFSIYIAGLTNAYRWVDPPGAYASGDPVGAGRQFQRKMLKLNFWRPGDEFDENEKEIRFGMPGELDYEWLYR